MLAVLMIATPSSAGTLSLTMEDGCHNECHVELLAIYFTVALSLTGQRVCALEIREKTNKRFGKGPSSSYVSSFSPLPVWNSKAHSFKVYHSPQARFKRISKRISNCRNCARRVSRACRGTEQQEPCYGETLITLEEITDNETSRQPVLQTSFVTEMIRLSLIDVLPCERALGCPTPHLSSSHSKSFNGRKKSSLDNECSHSRS